MSHYNRSLTNESQLRRRNNLVPRGSTARQATEPEIIQVAHNESMVSVGEPDPKILNTTIVSNRCESCGRDNEDTVAQKPGRCYAWLHSVATWIDNFIANWFESGFWHLFNAIAGLAVIYVLFWALFFTCRFLKQFFIEMASPRATQTGSSDDSMSIYAKGATVLFTILCFVLTYNYVREARLENKYLNKGMFGRPKPGQTNGLRQLTVAEYERQMQETTEREKAKLVESEAYQTAIKKKGHRQAAWNWQTREKELAQGHARQNHSQVYEQVAMAPQQKFVTKNANRKSKEQVVHDNGGAEAHHQQQMLSGRELLDQDFSDEGEAYSEMEGRAPPIEVQLMNIDNLERHRRETNQNHSFVRGANANVLDLTLAERQNNNGFRRGGGHR